MSLLSRPHPGAPSRPRRRPLLQSLIDLDDDPVLLCDGESGGCDCCASPVVGEGLSSADVA
jgi:hypothetical protein